MLQPAALAHPSSHQLTADGTGQRKRTSQVVVQRGNMIMVAEGNCNMLHRSQGKS